jgi:hypothetical protein
MKILKYITLSFISGAFLLTGCTDDFDEVNTNPNKVYNVDINDVFAGTMKRTMDVFSLLNYERALTFSRYAVVGAFYDPKQDLGDNYYNSFYVGILNDLVKIDRRYSAMEDKEVYRNRLAITKTWEAYVYYMMVSMFGPIPMSDAITDGTSNKRSYKYDSERDVYVQILQLLKDANDLYNPESTSTNDVLKQDLLFGESGLGSTSDIAKWRRFSNTLRLNVALQMQNIDLSISQENAKEALSSDLMGSNDDNAVFAYGNEADKSSSYYWGRFSKVVHTGIEALRSVLYPAINENCYIYLRSLNDPRLSSYALPSKTYAPATENSYLYTDTISRPHICTKRGLAGVASRCPDYEVHQADGLNKDRRDLIIIKTNEKYVPMPETMRLPSGWSWDVIPNTTNTYTDALNGTGEYGYSFVPLNFVGEKAKIVIYNYADVCFLKAEAAMLFDNNEAKAKIEYEKGIRASLEQWGYSTDDADKYLEQDGVKWGTTKLGFHDRRLLYQATVNGSNDADGLKEQIYKQHWLADFFNGLEGWNLERRTRTFNWPPFFSAGAASDVEGMNPTYNFWSERITYPESETQKNEKEYYKAVDLLQKASPYPRKDRWGDNVFTSLAFAKKNPQMDNADDLWLNHAPLISYCDYFRGYYGKTYEEIVDYCKKTYEINDETKALKKIEYAWQSTIETYFAQ